MNDVELALKENGFTNNEVKIYIASLILGSAKASEIAHKSEMLRTSTYEILTSLVERGICSVILKANVKYFEVISPQVLIENLKEKQEKLARVLPQLRQIQKTIIRKPTSEVFEGKKGLQSLLDKIITEKPEELLQLSSFIEHTHLPHYFPHWIKKRIEAKIPTRIINVNNETMKDYKQTESEDLREVRFLPKDFICPTANYIYGDTVIILDCKENEIIGIVIKSKANANAQRSFFNLLWEKSIK